MLSYYAAVGHMFVGVKHRLSVGLECAEARRHEFTVDSEAFKRIAQLHSVGKLARLVQEAGPETQDEDANIRYA